MTEIKSKINSIELIKWVVLPYLILSFLGGLGGQGFVQDDYYQSIAYSIDANPNAFGKIHTSDWSSYYKFLQYFEIEVEENDDDDDHQYSNSKLAQRLLSPLVLNETSSGSSLLPKQKIKLFILFHSWKSFLPV